MLRMRDVYDRIREYMKTYYIHTIDGHVAYYVDGEQIYFAQHDMPLRELLVESLSDIRKHERASAKWRREQGFHDDYGNHGYLRVRGIREHQV